MRHRFTLEQTINFSTITACGESCTVCKKKLMVYVKVVLSWMAMFQNGQIPADAKYMHVQKIIMCNFAAYAGIFLVNS